MTQEIIEMARDSGMELYGLGKDRARFVHHLVAFANLVAAKALAEHAMQEVQRLGLEIEQEPVAWVKEDVCDGQYIDGRPRKIWWECNKGVGTAFYTTPPQRTWVGLTEDEIKPCWHEACQTDLELTSQLVVYFAKAIEAKLKEKNSG